jgi:hypothetical protein
MSSAAPGKPSQASSDQGNRIGQELSGSQEKVVPLPSALSPPKPTAVAPRLPAAKIRRIERPTSQSARPERPAHNPGAPLPPEARKPGALPEGQGGSIIDFNPAIPACFVDPYTIEAMRVLGIVDSDIQYPSDWTLNTYSRDPEFREIARKELCARVDELIAAIKEKRNSLRQANTARRDSPPAAEGRSSPPTNPFLEEHARKVAVIEKREVQTVLIDLLVKAEARKSIDIRNEVERRRRAALERKQQDAFERGEQRRLAQVAAGAQRIAALQAQREKEIEEREKLAKQRDRERIKRFQEEIQKMADTRAEKATRVQEQLAKAHEAQRAEIEARRLEAAEKDRRVEEARRRHEDGVAAKRREFAVKEQQRLANSIEARRKADEEFELAAQEYRRKEAEFAARHADLTKLRHEKAAESVRSYDANLNRAKQNREEFNSCAQAKSKGSVQECDEKITSIEKQKAVHDRERARQALIERIRREQRGSTASRLERQRNAGRQDRNAKLDEHFRRIEQTASETASMREMAIAKRAKLDIELDNVMAQMEALKMREKDDTAFMRQIALEHGIDFNDLLQRIEERKRRPLPKLPEPGERPAKATKTGLPPVPQDKASESANRIALPGIGLDRESPRSLNTQSEESIRHPPIDRSGPPDDGSPQVANGRNSRAIGDGFARVSSQERLFDGDSEPGRQSRAWPPATDFESSQHDGASQSGQLRDNRERDLDDDFEVSRGQSQELTADFEEAPLQQDGIAPDDPADEDFDDEKNELGENPEDDFED